MALLVHKTDARNTALTKQSPILMILEEKEESLLNIYCEPTLTQSAFFAHNS